MFGKHPRINPLESRKRLLVAESELNRAQLAQEWVAMTAGVRTLTNRVKSLGSIVSAGTLLLGGLTSFRRHQPGNTAAKPSWFQTALKAAELAGSLWLAFRRRSQ